MSKTKNDYSFNNLLIETTDNVRIQTEQARRLLMGLNAISRKNIKYLTRRKWKYMGEQKHGLTSCAIDAYIFLCLNATSDGFIRNFSHDDFTGLHGGDKICSDRAVYNILQLLESNGLIKVSGKKYSHFRDITLLNCKIKEKERFLNLNHSFFLPGEEDHEVFKQLSVGPKSLLLYVLYSQHFEVDASGNVFEIKISELAREMGVKKQTAIRYIKQINEAFHRTIIIPSLENEGTKSIELSALNVKGLIYDERVKYDSLSLPIDFIQYKRVQNRSLGFWREFNTFLQEHNIKERTILGRNLTDPASYGTSKEKMDKNRYNFFNVLYHALCECNIHIHDVYKIVLRQFRKTGYFDEIAVAAISNNIALLLQ